MRIDRVSYEELVSFGNFQNAKIGASATVSDDEVATSVLARLQAYVHDELSVLKANRNQFEERLYGVEKLERQKIELEADLRHLTEKVGMVRDVLEANGINLGERYPLEDLPF